MLLMSERCRVVKYLIKLYIKGGKVVLELGLFNFLFGLSCF